MQCNHHGNAMACNAMQARPACPGSLADSRGRCGLPWRFQRARAAGSLWLAGPRQLAGRTVGLLSRIPRRARRGFLRVVATRRLFRCGPVWRATNPALDATAVVLPASALRHTPRGRRNHRPRRGVSRHRPEDFGVDLSAARCLNLFFHSHFSLFSRESFVRGARKKKTEIHFSFAKKC